MTSVALILYMSEGENEQTDHRDAQFSREDVSGMACEWKKPWLPRSLTHLPPLFSAVKVRSTFHSDGKW